MEKVIIEKINNGFIVIWGFHNTSYCETIEQAFEKIKELFEKAEEFKEPY